MCRLHYTGDYYSLMRDGWLSFEKEMIDADAVEKGFEEGGATKGDEGKRGKGC